MILASKRNFTKGSRILILGGTGFIGKYMQRELAARGYANVFVSGISHETGENRLKLNLCSEDDMKLINEYDFDLMINLTGQVSNPMIDCFRVNSQGIINLANGVKNTKAFLVHISTVGIYGSCPIADETSLPAPEVPYTTAKAMAELLLSQTLDSNQYAVVRLSNVYGEDQQKGLFSYLFRSARSDKELQFNNDGTMLRYYIHAADACKAIIDAIEQEENIFSGTFNLLGPDRMTLLEIIALLESLNNSKFNTILEPVKPYDNTLEIKADRFETMFKPEFKHSIKQYIQSNLKNVSRTPGI